MSNGDQLLRAYSTINALKANVPSDYEIEERWVREFNGAVQKVESSTGIDLAEFKVSGDDLYKSVASSNYLTEEVNYRDGLWCRREVLIHKLDALLNYFTGLQGAQEKKIGFNRN